METKLMVIDSTLQDEVIRNLSEKLKAVYIFPETAAELCERLREHQADGDYDGINEGEFFAYALTTHLQEVNHDEHLWVRWHAESLPEHDGPLRLNPQWQAERRLEAGLDHYGLHRLERMPGNVGYLDIHYFHRPEWGGETVAAALTFLAGSSALIIDLRQCLGGFPGMVALVCDSLFAQPTPLARIDWRDDGTTQEFCANREGLPRPLAETPVYVLTSQQTFSAGEMCAAALQSRRRALVVGEKTDGGAHAGASYRLNPHFEAFIPIGRVTDLLTGKDWEGQGVAPDVALPAGQALTAAYRMALEKIIESLEQPAPGPTRKLLDEAQTALEGLRQVQEK